MFSCFSFKYLRSAKTSSGFRNVTSISFVIEQFEGFGAVF